MQGLMEINCKHHILGVQNWELPKAGPRKLLTWYYQILNLSFGCKEKMIKGKNIREIAGLQRFREKLNKRNNSYETSCELNCLFQYKSYSNKRQKLNFSSSIPHSSPNLIPLSLPPLILSQQFNQLNWVRT